MKYLLLTLTLLASGVQLLRAQDHTATPIDGPVVRADSLKSRPSILPHVYNPLDESFQPYVHSLEAPVFETRQERAKRINRSVRASIMDAVRRDLPRFIPWTKPPLLRLTPVGFVRLSDSNPLILGREPGKVPYDNPNSPENFSQTIRTEYDFATGKYKIIPIPWEEYQKNYNVRFNAGNINNMPIPQVLLTPGDQIMHR